MGVGPEVVDYVAALAKLRLDDAEKDALAAVLARVLEFVEQLDRVDITDVPPTRTAFISPSPPTSAST